MERRLGSECIECDYWTVYSSFWRTSNEMAEEAGLHPQCAVYITLEKRTTRSALLHPRTRVSLYSHEALSPAPLIIAFQSITLRSFGRYNRPAVDHRKAIVRGTQHSPVRLGGYLFAKLRYDAFSIPLPLI